MKYLFLFLLPIFSFAQKKDSIQKNTISTSLQFEMNNSFLKKDSIKLMDMNLDKAKQDALEMRNYNRFLKENEQYRKDQNRDELLKINKSKGK